MTKKCNISKKEISSLYSKLIGNSKVSYESYRKRLVSKYGYGCFRDAQLKVFKKISYTK